MSIRELGPANQALFASFTCERFKEPWTKEPQEMVRAYLADALSADPALHAMGIVEDNELIAVAVWHDRPILGPVWEVGVIAVVSSHQGRKLARTLKEELIRRAKEEGITALLSYVDRRNDHMLTLNATLGGLTERYPGSYDLLVCTVPVR